MTLRSIWVKLSAFAARYLKISARQEHGSVTSPPFRELRQISPPTNHPNDRWTDRVSHRVVTLLITLFQFFLFSIKRTFIHKGYDWLKSIFVIVCSDKTRLSLFYVDWQTPLWDTNFMFKLFARFV